MLPMSKLNPTKNKIKKTGQDLQDEILRKMSVDKKIKLASALSVFCLKLNRFHENNKSRRTSD